MLASPNTVTKLRESEFEAEDKYEVDKLNLRFRDPEVEERYSYESIHSSRGLIRAYLAAAAALYLSFSVLDYLVGGGATEVMWFIRYAIVCPILLTGAATTYLPDFPRYAQPILSLTMFAPGAGVVAMTAIMPPPQNSLYYAGLVMVVIYGSALVRLRFLNAALISLALVGLYQAVVLWINPVPFSEYVSNNFFLVMASAVGLLSGYIQEVYIRRSYKAQKVIEAKNAHARLLLFEAEKANRSKDQFLANMSHELRTPLNAIIGFSQIMSERIYGALGDNRYEEYAGYIYDSGNHLLSIINDVLDLAKADAGKLSLNEDLCDLSACLADAVRMCAMRASSDGVEIAYKQADPGIYALVDERLVRQIVINLLTNAIKFSSKGAQVQLRIHADPQTDIVIQVQDSGVGIAPEDIDRVLLPFEQVEGSLTRTHGGTGLGLPLSRKLALLHGGDLTLESQVGVGTTATVCLPASRLRAAPEAEPIRCAV